MHNRLCACKGTPPRGNGSSITMSTTATKATDVPATWDLTRVSPVRLPGTIHSSEIEEIVKELSEQAPIRRDSLIPLLQMVQDSFGYLPRTHLIAISKYLQIPVSKVYGVATFYNQFRLQPVGKYTISVCCGTACHVRGSGAILEFLESELGIERGGTTSDGLFTLQEVACLGACGIAPVVKINDQFFGRLTPKSVQKVLKQFRNL